MSEKKNKGLNWDGKSRVSTNAYRNNWNEIFNQAKEFVYGQKENEELAESYKESKRQTEERKTKERLTSPLDSFSEDLQNSIKESRRQTKKRKNFHPKAIDGYSE